jgi:hypothetical protein
MTNLNSADFSILLSDPGEAFVDDTRIGCTTTYNFNDALSPEDNTKLAEEDVIAKLHQLSQTWEHLLFATGGTICLQKKFWYLLSWQWTKLGKPHPTTITVSPGTLKLTSGKATHQPIEVPRIESTSSHLTQKEC